MTEMQPEYEASVKRPKVAIADKNPVVRSGLRDFISRDGRFQIVGTLPTGGEFSYRAKAWLKGAIPDECEERTRTVRAVSLIGRY